jgi:hypothetical protein
MIKEMKVLSLRCPNSSSGEKYPRNIYFDIGEDPACLIVHQLEDNHEVDKWNWAKVTDIHMAEMTAKSKECLEFTIEVRSSHGVACVRVLSSTLANSVGCRKVHIQNGTDRGAHVKPYFLAIQEEVHRGDPTGGSSAAVLRDRTGLTRCDGGGR